MLYIRLFHGRIDPAQDLDEWGSDGPIFGPCKFVHTTYTSLVRLGYEDGSCDELLTFEDMLYYDDHYYGDWSIFGEETLETGKYQTIIFEQSKADLPRT